MCVSFTWTRHDRKSFGWGIPIKEELFMSYQLWIIGFQPWPLDLCDQGDFWLLEEIGKIKIKNDWFALHLVFLPGLLFHSNSPDSQTCHLRTSVKGWQPKVKNNTLCSFINSVRPQKSSPLTTTHSWRKPSLSDHDGTSILSQCPATQTSITVRNTHDLYHKIKLFFEIVY